jgi:hypothetical protein
MDVRSENSAPSIQVKNVKDPPETVSSSQAITSTENHNMVGPNTVGYNVT